MNNSRGFRIASAIIVVLLSVSMGLPFLIMVSVSLQSMHQIYSPSFEFLPAPFQWGNYAQAMTNGDWGRYLWNSFYITGTVTVVSLFINSMTGYAFARIRFKGRNALFLLLLVGMMIPPQVTMLPLFIMMRRFPLAGGNDLFGVGGTGLHNTALGLMIPYLAGSFGVFLCRQFYSDFPHELDEAARIDGCSRMGTYLRIYLPLSTPVLASLGILKFTGTWNEYTWPLVMTTGEKLKTVQIALTAFRNEAEIFWNELMAATLVSTAVILVIFLLLQRHFVAGLLAGSVKE